LPALIARLPVSHARVSLDYKAKRFVAGAHLPLPDGHFWWKVVLSDAAQAELCCGPARNGTSETVALFRAAAESAGSEDWLAQLQAIDAHVYLPDNILTKADRMSMAHSLEARVPYLDRALVELAARLPRDVKLRGWTKKWVLKRALKDHVPAAILHAKKRGFNVPVPSWLRGELRDMVADVLSPTALRRVGLFDPAYVETLIGEHNAMRVDHSRPLWTLLVFMIWHEHWQNARAAGARAAFAPAGAPSVLADVASRSA
jgi:asparagine synthase (glutamine-hydrolysing)